MMSFLLDVWYKKERIKRKKGLVRLLIRFTLLFSFSWYMNQHVIYDMMQMKRRLYLRIILLITYDMTEENLFVNVE